MLLYASVEYSRVYSTDYVDSLAQQSDQPASLLGIFFVTLHPWVYHPYPWLTSPKPTLRASSHRL